MVLVEQLRLRFTAQQMDRGHLVGRPTHHLERAAEVQPGVVRPTDPVCGALRLTACEGLAHPATELIAVGVVEPPHEVARRLDLSVERAFLAVGQLALLVRSPYPRHTAPTCPIHSRHT